MNRWSFILAFGAMLTAVSCRNEGRTCELGSTHVEFVLESELRSTSEHRLELSRGDLADCARAEYQVARQTIARALDAFPEPVERLTVHVDPHMPSAHAPLQSIEVHVGSREVLVDSKALSDLSHRAWVHELAHVVAREPPPPLVARRLWLTVEEALAQYLEASVLGARDDREPPTFDAESAPWELLAGAAYDPHVLAEGLAVELGTAARITEREALGCLRGGAPGPGSRPNTARGALAEYLEGCPPSARPAMSSAFRTWLPAALEPEL